MELIGSQLDFTRMLPRAHRAWGPLIRDALRHLVKQLPDWRRHELLMSQRTLPADAPAARRLTVLLGGLPTLHKLGQLVARRRDLDAALRLQLQTLESLEGRTATEEFSSELNEVIARWPDMEIQIDPRPLAEGSVAVVVPFRWRDPRTRLPQRGVFKVLRPGITARLAEDLAAWATLPAWLDAHWAAYDVPKVDYADPIERVSRLLTHEVRVEQEQANLRCAGLQLQGQDGMGVPELLPFCTSRVTAMTRIEGRKITDAQGDSKAEGCARATQLVQATLAGPVWSAFDDAIFHADPHPGNVRIGADGRLWLFDWSLAGRLRKRTREQMVQLVLAAACRDSHWMMRAVEGLATRLEDRARIRAHVQSALLDRPWPCLPGITWLARLIDALVLEACVGFDDDLLLFRKSLFMIEGTAAELSDRVCIDDVFASCAQRRFLAEWPGRWLAPPGSRRFSTHVSNLDLWAAGAGWLTGWLNAATGSSSMRA